MASERRQRGQVDQRQAIADAGQDAADRARDGQDHQEDPEEHHAQLDRAPAGDVLAVVVEQQHAHHDADAERQHDHDQVLRREAERVAGEGRPEDRHDPDQRRGDAEVRQRPGDGAVVPDIADPLAQLVEHARDGMAWPR